MFINFTNHSSMDWSKAQREAASVYGEIVDIPFPDVDPFGDGDYISSLADKYISEISKYKPAAVLCQGEMTLAFAVVNRFRKNGVPVFAACSTRNVNEYIGTNGETVKRAEFIFVQFRKYL